MMQICKSYIYVYVYVCVCVASGAAGALYENECRVATQAECFAGPAEEHRGEEGRHGGRPEGEKQRNRKPPSTARQNQQQHAGMHTFHTGYDRYVSLLSRILNKMLLRDTYFT